MLKDVREAPVPVLGAVAVFGTVADFPHKGLLWRNNRKTERLRLP